MLKEEMKKIWRPGMLLALLVLGFVFYLMYLSIYIRYFPSGSQNSGLLEVGMELVEAYGTSLSHEEMEEFASGLPELRKEADQYVQESEIGKKHGLKTYEEYAAFQKKAYEEVSRKEVSADTSEAYADAMRLGHYLQSEETHNAEGRLYGASWMVEMYRVKQTQKYREELGTDGEEEYSEKELEHARNVFYGKDQMWQNILPPEVPKAIGSYIGYLLVWICLSLCLLLSPMPVHDRMSRMLPLQYSSRHGRKICKTQFAAVMLTTFLVTTANLAVFGGLFLTHGTAVFFPCRMYSFAGTQFCWPDWTHGVWCLMLVLLCYLTAFGTAGTAFFLSVKCPNYIVMLLKVLPLFIVMALFAPKLMEDAFYYSNALYRFSGLPYAELLCAGVVFAAGMLLCGCGYRRLKKNG